MHQKRWYYGSFPRRRDGPFFYAQKESKMATDFTCANFAHVGADADQTYKLPMKGR